MSASMCQLWTGHIRFLDKVRRLVLKTRRRRSTGGEVVLSICGNPQCVNETHLYSIKAERVHTKHLSTAEVKR